MPTSKKFAALLVALGAITLTGCDGKNTANEKNFGLAMSQYLDQQGDLCLNNYREYPAKVVPSPLQHQQEIAKQMAALESVGLVQCETTGEEKTCSLTAAAKPFTREKTETGWTIDGARTSTHTDLCWGKTGLDSVVRWEGPMKSGDYQEALVFYTYKVDNLADWAMTPKCKKLSRG